MGILFNENAISGGNYIIANSLRFQSASGQYATRTFTTPTSSTIYTLSTWVKRGALGGTYRLFGASTTTYLTFNSSDQLNLTINNVSAATSAAVYRDPSSWYHIVYTQNGSAQTLYVNNTSIATGTTAASVFNTAIAHQIGSANTSNYFDGYMAEVNFIDGQALTPSSFGTTDVTSGQWVAAKYTGTYGTNGFYLPFSNGTSTTTLGADSSGNSNNWTLTNFTRSAGVSDCWMYDVPSGNGGASGTQPSSNYAVLNPLSKMGSPTVTNANLQVSTGTNALVNGSVVVSSGKWYCEFTYTSGSDSFFGFNRVDLQTGTGNTFQQAGSMLYYSTNGNLYSNGNGGAAYGSSYTANDVIGCALNLDANQVTFYKNNVAQSTVSITAGNYTACLATGGVSIAAVANFGQRSFAYTPPSGFKALCTANLPVATIKQGNKYMDATLYTGNLTGQSITNASSFTPDLVWVKSRSAATDNKLTDSVRGVQKALISNSTAAETTDLTGLTAFNANGFTVGASTTYNNTGATYVGWQWQAGQGSTSSNTNGSITSTVSVNATAGFSVVTYTGTGANATVGHGLGVAPAMLIIKQRSGGTARAWQVYHASMGNGGGMYLNQTNAYTADATAFNNTSPTSSVFTVGTSVYPNQSGSPIVAYCFAEIAGFSKFGSYTGNGSTDGPFVYCGFRPKYVMIKNTSVVSNWIVYDTTRSPYNQVILQLFPNTSDAEDNTGAIDILSNGFKFRSTNANWNGNGNSIIYMAFAENPFAQANAR